MRLLGLKLTILLSLAGILCTAESPGYKICGQQCTFIEFSLLPHDNWPVYFRTVTTNDTLTINTSSFDNFTENLYSRYPYVQYPNFYNKPTLNIYRDIFGEMPDDSYKTARLLSISFLNDFEKQARNGKIILSDGNTVYYRYGPTSTILADVDKNRFWTDNSNELQDSSIINQLVLPISVEYLHLPESVSPTLTIIYETTP